MLKDLRELEKDIDFIKSELEKNLSNEDKNLLLTLMDLQNIKQKRLWDLAYIERKETIGDGIISLTKKKVVNKVLNMNNDKLEEVASIIDILNDPDMRTDDIRKIKFYILGYMSKKNNSKENYIKSTYDQEERLNYLSTLVEVLDNIDNKLK